MTGVRPMTAADAEAVLGVQWAAFAELDRRLGRPPKPEPEPGTEGRRPWLRRIEHLMDTDPGGAWVATDAGGEVTGAALALVREGVWGLSLLVVHPDHQSAGAGGALLRAALDHGSGARGGIILGSEDARALRVYARAGFALRPTFDAEGTVTRPPSPSPAVREAAWPEGEAAVDAASRHVRGATHARDVPVLLQTGADLLVHERGGWAAFDDGGRLRALAAPGEAAAGDLLRSALARVPAGGPASIAFVDAANAWAYPIALEAGLQLRPGGAICVRGDVGPMAPFLPSGAYL